MTLENSLVLGHGDGNVVGDYTNMGGNITGGFAVEDVFAAVEDTPGTGGMVQRGVLADNGGPVATIALLADAANPALDAGLDSVAPATDARGELRVDQPGLAHNGANIADIGAFELQDIVDGPPDAVDDAVATSILEPSSLTIDVLANDTDPGNDALTVVGVAGAAISVGQTIALDSGARVTLQADGTLTYDKLFLLAAIDDPGEDVIDAFAYTISDGGETDGATVTVTLEGLDIPVDVTGTSGADILKGTAGTNLMWGRGGDDVMFGNAGSDAMVGQNGDDLMFGGSGNDILTGGGGSNLLFGGEGNDLLVGGSGMDGLYGGAGNDVLTASTGGSILDGGAGNDALAGSVFGPDTFVFNGGEDLISFFDPDEDAIDLTAFGLADVQSPLDTARRGFFTTVFDLGDDELTVLGAGLNDFNDSNVLV